MVTLKAEWQKYLLGGAIIVALVLGGGTSAGLWTDSLVQIVLLCAAAPILASRTGEAIDRRVLWLSGLILAAMLIQLVPFPPWLIEALRPDVFASGRVGEGGGSRDYLSLGLGRTIESILYVAALLALTLALLRLRGEQLHALLPFVMAGIACHAAAAAIQYSASETVQVSGYMPFTIKAGLFANRNHLASLLYASLPLLLYIGTFRGMGLWAGLSMLVVLLVLLAAGSRAGALLGLAALVLSALFLASRTRAGIGSFLVFVTVVGIYSLATWTLLDARELDPDFGRMEFARNTLQGIGQNWALGIGYGNFHRAYQVYENPEFIFRAFVNHAHNDYLEIIFEGGLIAAILIIAYLATILVQLISVRHSHFQKAAFLSLFFILLHSTVDYPLRTMAVATAFCFFNAVLFHGGFRPAETRTGTRIKVRHNGRELSVPIEEAGS